MSTYHTTSPRLMWAAPYCLHDTSSGSAMHMKNMLEQFTKRGVHCAAIAALTFDAPIGYGLLENFSEQIKDDKISWLNVQDKGVHYSYLKTEHSDVNKMTRAEEIQFFSYYISLLDTFRPDIILLYGASPMELAIILEAKKRGISIVMIIFNGSYASYSFPHVDMLLTDSPATVKTYYDNSKVNVLTTGTFIYPENVISSERDPKYITLINPHPSKGISIVLRLALMAQKKHPHWKFLVVNGRGTFDKSMQIYEQDPKKFKNIEISENKTDVREIYAKTKILLAPSLWYECFCRSAAEAMMNGIPVLASTSGGLPSTVNGGGLILEAPQKCHDDFAYLPSASELEKWYEGLEEMMDDTNYTAWSQKALEASKIHNMEDSTNKALAYLAPLFAKKPSLQAHYFEGCKHTKGKS